MWSLDLLLRGAHSHHFKAVRTGVVIYCTGVHIGSSVPWKRLRSLKSKSNKRAHLEFLYQSSEGVGLYLQNIMLAAVEAALLPTILEHWWKTPFVVLWSMVFGKLMFILLNGSESCKTQEIQLCLSSIGRQWKRTSAGKPGSSHSFHFL